MSDKLTPLREMAERWKYSASDFPVRDLAFQDAAEELFAWCDAAEAELNKGPATVSSGWVRAALIGEKKKCSTTME